MKQWSADRTILCRRVIMAVAGILLTGISVALFNTIAFGTDPFSCLTLGVWYVTGIPYRFVYMLVNGLLLAGVFFLDRHYIGLATVMNLLFMGSIVELFMPVFDSWLPGLGLGVKLLFLCLAVILMCFAASLYFTADLGVSTYDAWALILSKKKNFPFKLCRISTDIVCTAAGFLMGAVVGVGTVITALGMGPFIEFFNKTCSGPMLYGTGRKTGENRPFRAD